MIADFYFLTSRGFPELCRKSKPDSSTSRDLGARSRLAELLTKSRDVRIDDVGAGIEVHVPDFVVQLTASDYLARAEHQMLEQLELHRRKADIVGVAGDASCQAIEHEVSDAHLFFSATFFSVPGENANAGAKLLVRHWLDDVIVRAGVQPAHDRLGIGAARVEQHRRVAAVAPQLLQDLEAMAVPELQIQDDAVIVVH